MRKSNFKKHHKKRYRKIRVFSHVRKIGMLFALCVCATLFFSGHAYAKTITYLDSAAQTPETTAYFRQFSSSHISNMRVSDRIGMYDAQYNDDDFWEHGLVFYLNEDEHGYFLVNDAVSVDMQDIGFTVDGKQLDGTITYSVEGSGSTHTVGGLRAAFLVINCQNQSVSWECTSISIGQDNKSSGAECARTSVYTKLYLYEHDTGSPYYGRLAFYVADLDVGRSSLPEQVRICNGFADDVYVSKDTQLDRNELVASGGTHFVATRDFEPTSFLNGFVAYINNPWSDWWWSGFSCGTEFGSICETYPSTVVSGLEKQISAVDGKAPTEPVPVVKRGNTVDYCFSQTYPYVVASNAAKSIEVTDTLDSRLDLAKMQLEVQKVIREGGQETYQDVTYLWRLNTSGQKVRISAANPLQIGGTYRFFLHRLVVKSMSATGELFNAAQSTVIPNNTSQSSVVANSNTVKMLIEPRYDFLRVTKTITADQFVTAHGNPTFFFCLEGKKNGVFEKMTQCVCFDNVSDASGSYSKSVTFSLAGFDGEVKLYELDSLRYKTVDVRSPNKDVRLDNNVLIFNLGGSADGTTLEATFVNKKVFQEKTSDTALVINKAKR